MIDHISFAVSDLGRSREFYAPVLSTLGLTVLVERPDTVGFGKTYPEFWINLRRDMAPVDAASGVHICLRARSRDIVQAFFDTALACGGTVENAPRFWPEYNAHYFAAFVRDPDGNRIEAVHFTDANS